MCIAINYNVIFMDEKIISFNECNFKFTNNEVSITITSTFKLLMEIILFQCSQVSKHLEWKPQVNAWFSRIKVNINFNICLY